MVQVFLETISGSLSLKFVYETHNRRFKIPWILSFFSFVASRIFMHETRSTIVIFINIIHEYCN